VPLTFQIGMFLIILIHFMTLSALARVKSIAVFHFKYLSFIFATMLFEMTSSAKDCYGLNQC
jgi:hypothetical protein